MWFEIDVPISRDFLCLEERKLGRAMTRDEMATFLMQEFHWARWRADQIISTIKGEKFV